MKFLSALPVLSTLLAAVSSAPAEPIPADVSVHSLRAVQDGTVIESFSKRALTDDLFGTDGSGARYWAWAKLAYDGEYNDQPGKDLGSADGKPWAKLGGSEIFVKGVVGRTVQGIAGWPVFTGMKAVVGKDSTNKVIVMSFIGSNDRPTFKQDIKYAHVSDSAGAIQGRLEKGFYECYDSVKTTVFDWAKQYADANTDWDIVITGHSLGGATAHVAAAGWAAANPDLASRTTVFTYGAPRAGDLAFQQALAAAQGGRMANFQHVHDIVPHVPLIHGGPEYANAGNRWVFTPSGNSPSWFDSNAWESRDAPDTTTAIKDGIVSIVEDVMNKFAEHTAYFSTTNVPGRSYDLVEDDIVLIAKRAPPTTEQFQAAEGLVGQMRQSGELSRQPELTSNLEKFTDTLGIVNEQEDLLNLLSKLPDQDSRVDALKYTEIFAMEQA